MYSIQRATARLALLLTGILIGALGCQAGAPEIVEIVPTLTGNPERCLTCHLGIEEISASHPEEEFGCVICHGGDAMALDEDLAHEKMRGGSNPSSLDVVNASCGAYDCHNGSEADGRNHIHRVTTSVQATYAGDIAQTNYAFGGQPDLVARFGIKEVFDPHITTETGLPSLEAFHTGPDSPPGMLQFEENCLDCHLWTEPIEQAYFYRGSGCAACHVIYDNDGLYKGEDPAIPRDEPGHGRKHEMTTVIPYSQCNHCHNRGTFSSRQMAFLQRDDLGNAHSLSARDERELDYYQPISQFTLCEWELDCIDCHTSGEVMGDGDIHSSQAEIQYIQCKTCHGTLSEMPQLVTIEDAEHPAILSSQLNPNYAVAVGDTIIATAQGETFGWVKWLGGALIETAKVDGVLYEVPLLMGSACEQQEAEQESHFCHECHTYERTVMP